MATLSREQYDYIQKLNTEIELLKKDCAAFSKKLHAIGQLHLKEYDRIKEKYFDRIDEIYGTHTGNLTAWALFDDPRLVEFKRKHVEEDSILLALKEELEKCKRKITQNPEYQYAEAKHKRYMELIDKKYGEIYKICQHKIKHKEYYSNDEEKNIQQGPIRIECKICNTTLFCNYKKLIEKQNKW